MAQSKRFADWHDVIRPQENWIRSLQEMNVHKLQWFWSNFVKKSRPPQQCERLMLSQCDSSPPVGLPVVYMSGVLCVSPFLPSLCLCFVTGRSGPRSLGAEGRSSRKRSRAGACHTCRSSAAARCSWLQSAPESLLKQVAELQTTVDRWVWLVSTATACYFWKALYQKDYLVIVCVLGFFSLGVGSGVLHRSRATAIHTMHVCTWIREESSWEPQCWSLHIYRCSL